MPSRKLQTTTSEPKLGTKKSLIGFVLFLVVFSFSASQCMGFSSDYVEYLQLKETAVYVPAVVSDVKERIYTDDDTGEDSVHYNIFISYEYNEIQYTDVFYDSVENKSSIPESVTIAISSKFPEKIVPSHKSVLGLIFSPIITLSLFFLPTIAVLIILYDKSTGFSTHYVSVEIVCDEINRSAKLFSQKVRLALFAFLTIFFGVILLGLMEKYGFLNIISFGVFGLLAFVILYSFSSTRFVKPEDFSIRTETYLKNTEYIDDDGHKFLCPTFSNIGSVSTRIIRGSNAYSKTVKGFSPGDVVYVVMKHKKKKDTVAFIYPAKEFIFEQDDGFNQNTAAMTNDTAPAVTETPYYTNDPFDVADPFNVDDPFKDFD